MKAVYICSPYAGEVETNVQNAREYCKYAVSRGLMPLAPHLLFPQFMDDANEDERTLGMQFGLDLLSKCDEIWVFGERVSGGMAAEISHAERINIPIKQFNHEEVMP